MADILNLNLQSSSELNIQLSGDSELTLQPQVAANIGTTNYEWLRNKPEINGVRLSGNKTLPELHIFSENTTYGWGRNSSYIPRRGEICLYTDTHMIKIGDGSVPIIDLPYIKTEDSQAIMDALLEHTNNIVIHVTEEDRLRWDSKLNYTAVGETLIFNRD